MDARAQLGRLRHYGAKTMKAREEALIEARDMAWDCYRAEAARARDLIGADWPGSAKAKESADDAAEAAHGRYVDAETALAEHYARFDVQ